MVLRGRHTRNDGRHNICIYNSDVSPGKTTAPQWFNAIDRKEMDIQLKLIKQLNYTFSKTDCLTYYYYYYCKIQMCKCMPILKIIIA